MNDRVNGLLEILVLFDIESKQILVLFVASQIELNNNPARCLGKAACVVGTSRSGLLLELQAVSIAVSAGLITAVDESVVLKKAVCLGMDGVYDSAGRLDETTTEFMISNDCVLSTVAAHPNHLLAGVSINPCRRDALDEVTRCAERGAFLVKVLPNTQQFNPWEERFRPFYRALAERELPFLSHVGF